MSHAPPPTRRPRAARRRAQTALRRAALLALLISGCGPGVTSGAVGVRRPVEPGAAVSGDVFCWGANDNGQVSPASESALILQPVQVALPAEALAVEAGKGQTCALTVNGEVVCWGVGAATVEAVGGLPRVRAVDVGAGFACALGEDDALYCWGANADGQLGDGSFVARQEPQPVKGLASVKTFAVGFYHVCATTHANSVLCWGENDYNNLANGTQADSAAPVVIAAPGLVKLFPGNGTMCGVDAAQVPYCWGDNTDGMLGLPLSIEHAERPDRLSTLALARSISSGSYHSCGADEQGAVFCWGNAGQAALANAAPLGPRPSRVAQVEEAVTVAVGNDHSCALERDGDVLCWGANDLGQLGAPASRDGSPGRVPLPRGAASLSAGADHTCAVVPR